MKNNILKIVLVCTFFIFTSSGKEKSKPKIKPSIAGVVLSFDDEYINDWFATNQKLKRYSWQASFCVSKINTLNVLEINKLRELQKEGHEIAGHSYNHYNAVNFISERTIQEYLDDEINPMMDLMSFYGFRITSFVYPFGSRNKILDAALLNKFKIIRGRAFCETNPIKQGCYYDNKRLVYSFSIDDTHNHFDIPYLYKLLDFAKKNNKILILNSHKTVKNVSGDYQTKDKTLEVICKYIKKNNMKFYSLSDLSPNQNISPF
jgi:peptidoglycan/xylan/chitin deacetylase (PgdA/CDA1 family)